MRFRRGGKGFRFRFMTRQLLVFYDPNYRECSVRPEESLAPKTPDKQAEIFLRVSDRSKNVELRKILMFAMKGSDGLGEIPGAQY